MNTAEITRNAARFVRHRFQALHPYDVEINLLNACNLRCRYCSCPLRETALLSTEQWVAFLAWLGTVGTIRVRFQGGEPTMRRDFRELSRAVKNMGATCAVTTNGTRIAESPELLDHLDEVVVSVDSADPQYHDRLRGPGGHALALRTMELALERGLRVVATMTMTRENVHELDALLALCEGMGVPLHAQPVLFGHPFFNDEARDLALDDTQEREVHARLAALKRAGRKLLFSAGTYEQVSTWSESYGVLAVPMEEAAGESPCMAGKFHIHVEANGDVHPCILHRATSFKPKNLVRDGHEAALTNAQHHDCRDCYTACLVERKRAFSLHPEVVLGVLRG